MRDDQQIATYIPKPASPRNDKFALSSDISQQIKSAMVQSAGYGLLTPSHREALDLIATNIGRIVADSPHLKDNWRGMIDCAALGLEACK